MTFKAKCSKSIIKKAARGDKFAITQLYMLYKKPIYRLAYRMLQDTHLASDIMQNVFIKLMQNISKLNSYEYLGGWLKTVTYNAVIDHIRVHSREVIMDSQLINDFNLSDVLSTIKESNFDAKKYLDTLSERERLIVYLSAVEGYTHKEIAKEIGITEINSRQIYRRSINKLISLGKLSSYSGKTEDKVNV